MVEPSAKPSSEEEVVSRARQSVSDCNWIVGECAAEWTQRYARGRTDADFGALIGMSGDQVYQRRRTWETFGDVRVEYPALRWSHFYVSLTWDDAPECLAWATENEATVAEMKAWRRLQHGEDLTQAADDAPPWEDEAPVTFMPNEPTPVRDPDDPENEGATGGETSRGGSERGLAPTATGVARGADEAGREVADEASTAVAERPPVSMEQVVKRMTTAIERVDKALTQEVIDALPDLPKKVRNRFVKAVGELSAKAARLL